MPTAPTAPNPWVISSYTNIRVAGKAKANSTGGATILQWQLGWGKSPSTPEQVGDLAADGSGFVAGLDPGTNYYFWNRQRNAYGWSALSARTSVRTRDVPDAPSAPAVAMKSQTNVNLFFAPGWNGDSSILEYRYLRGMSPIGPSTSISTGLSTQLHDIDLIPGETYYYWAQARNVYGWSAFSNRTEVILIAGARVNVGGVWKRAVPYVNDNGTWKMARAWVKQNGVWKILYD